MKGAEKELLESGSRSSSLSSQMFLASVTEATRGRDIPYVSRRPTRSASVVLRLEVTQKPLRWLEIFTVKFNFLVRI